MSLDWSLIEFRPGRYAKVSPQGRFLALATEAEIRAWFAAQPKAADPVPAPQPREQCQDARPSPLPGKDDLPAMPQAPDESREPVPVLPRTLAKQPLSALSLGIELGTRLPPRQASSAADSATGRPVPAKQESVALVPVQREAALPPVQAPGSESAAPEAESSPPSSPDPATPAPSRPSRQAAIPDPAEEAPGGPEPAPSRGPQAPAEVNPDTTRELVTDPAPAVGSAGAGYWLWVDPRQEPGYTPRSLGLEAFLHRAIARFQSKPWTAGRKPGRLAAHPDDTADGLKALVESLGLELVEDPLVPAGTYRLGLPTSDER
jgi:hypothetical protein